MNRGADGDGASMGPRRDRRGEENCKFGHHAGADASMGPRRDRRGEDGAAVGTSGAVLLQWGRVVIDAERVFDGDWYGSPYLLQWGRVVIDAERLVHEFGMAPEAAASMGPRRDRRGEAFIAGRVVLGSTASMGPRRDRRGEVSRE